MQRFENNQPIEFIRRDTSDMTLESIAPLSDGVPITLPTVAA